MSASQYRSQLERKRECRIDAEKKAGDYRTKESKKRADAAKARQAATEAKSEATARSKLREADRRDREAETAGKDAARWRTKASGYAKEEASLISRLARAEQSEADAAERRRQRDQQLVERRAAAEWATLGTRIVQTGKVVDHAVRHLQQPKHEKLRVSALRCSGALWRLGVTCCRQSRLVHRILLVSVGLMGARDARATELMSGVVVGPEDGNVFTRRRSGTEDPSGQALALFEWEVSGLVGQFPDHTCHLFGDPASDG